jgi:hypothetical protein
MIRIGSAVGRDRLRRRLKRVVVVWLPIVAYIVVISFLCLFCGYLTLTGIRSVVYFGWDIF